MTKQCLVLICMIFLLSPFYIVAMREARFVDINHLVNQVPDEIWEQIFSAQNKLLFIQPDMPIGHKAGIRWCAMKNIVTMSLVCQRCNAIAQKLLPSYPEEIKRYIGFLGGKDKAAYVAFTEREHGPGGNWWSSITEICKVMKTDLNTTKHTEMRGETLLTQALLKQDAFQTRSLLNAGADPKQRNQKGDMPIDLAHANGFFQEANLIKADGGDPDDKYEYKYDWKSGKHLCVRGHTGQAYIPQQTNALNAANNNPPPIPPQTFSLSSWISKSHAYIFLAGISASAVAYWLYTKYRTIDEDNVEKDDYLEADIEIDEENRLEIAQA